MALNQHVDFMKASLFPRTASKDVIRKMKKSVDYLAEADGVVFEVLPLRGFGLGPFYLE